MEWMAVEDMTNIMLICLLMGVGVVTLIGLLFGYLAALVVLETWND